MTGWITLGVLVALALALGVLVFVNGLAKRRKRVEAAWGQVDLHLRRRFELIPELVETVQGHVGEGETLAALGTARAAAGGAEGIAEQTRVEQGVDRALALLFAEAEAVPELKADLRFLSLEEELSATVGRIAYARQFYNETVLSYNTRLRSFPTVVLAGAFRYRARESFEAGTPSRGPVRVDF